ncbi:MAG TPA: AraC family transcriptional regulator [Puia sp.]|nr:AraC family transcriptional regulator [Puia sp.]
MVELEKIRVVDGWDRPRRVLRYLLVWVEAGEAVMVVDEKEYRLRQNDVITITSGQVHFFSRVDGEVACLSFSLDFICKDDNDIELIFHNGLFCHFGQNEVIGMDRPAEVRNLLDRIGSELVMRPYQYLISVRSYIELLLVGINRVKVERGDEIWKPDALFLRFLEAVRDNFSANLTVGDFAERLSTTREKLDELAKTHTGKTAQHVVYSLVISEAKRLLVYQDMSIKEIAYQLGFSDPFYFSNFFKKHAGQSPKAYKSAAGV